MKERFLNGIFVGIVLLITVLLFTVIDHAIHELEKAWSVPDYYFRNKIPFGFLWGIVGLLFARKFQSIWIKSLLVSGVISIILQFRYFIEGYPLNFVLSFLLIHFIILYLLSVGMFFVLNIHINNLITSNNYMKKIIIAILMLIIVCVGVYYLVFSRSENASEYGSNLVQNALIYVIFPKILFLNIFLD